MNLIIDYLIQLYFPVISDNIYFPLIIFLKIFHHPIFFIQIFKTYHYTIVDSNNVEILNVYIVQKIILNHIILSAILKFFVIRFFSQ